MYEETKQSQIDNQRIFKGIYKSNSLNKLQIPYESAFQKSDNSESEASYIHRVNEIEIDIFDIDKD